MMRNSNCFRMRIAPSVDAGLIFKRYKTVHCLGFIVHWCLGQVSNGFLMSCQPLRITSDDGDYVQYVLISVPTGIPSRGGDVVVYVKKKKTNRACPV